MYGTVSFKLKVLTVQFMLCGGPVILAFVLIIIIIIIIIITRHILIRSVHLLALSIKVRINART